MRNKLFTVDIELINSNQIIVNAKSEREAKEKVMDIIQNSNFLENNIISSNPYKVNLVTRRLKKKNNSVFLSGIKK